MAVEAAAVLSAVFSRNPNAKYMQMLKDHLLSTLSPEGSTAQAKEHIAGAEEPQRLSARNLLLNMLFTLLSSPSRFVDARSDLGEAGGSEGGGLLNAITECLGPEFFLLFLSRGMADSTVLAVLKTLACLLANPKSPFLAKFRAVDGFDTMAVLLLQHCHLDGVYYIALGMYGTLSSTFHPNPNPNPNPNPYP